MSDDSDVAEVETITSTQRPAYALAAGGQQRDGLLPRHKRRSRLPRRARRRSWSRGPAANRGSRRRQARGKSPVRTRSRQRAPGRACRAQRGSRPTPAAPNRTKTTTTGSSATWDRQAGALNRAVERSGAVIADAVYAITLRLERMSSRDETTAEISTRTPESEVSRPAASGRSGQLPVNSAPAPDLGREPAGSGSVLRRRPWPRRGPASSRPCRGCR